MSIPTSLTKLTSSQGLEISSQIREIADTLRKVEYLVRGKVWSREEVEKYFESRE